MKLKNLFFAGLALCTFAACSNEDEPKQGNGEAAALTIGIATSSQKAVGSSEESKISTMEVVIFNADNSFVIRKAAAANAATVTFDKATSGLKQGNAYKVVVIANTAIPAGNPSLASLQTLQTTSDAAQANNNFVMSGEANTTLANTDGNTVTVTVARATAKVNLSKLSVKMTDAVSDVKSFLVETVYIANGAAASLVYNGNQTSNLSLASPGYLSGLLDQSFGKINTAATQNNNLVGNFANPLEVIESGAVASEIASFYTLANSRTADTEYAYLVIKGKLTYKTAGKPNSDIFYAVPVKTDNAPLINRNTIYNVEATIKGVTGNGNPADLTVTVTVADWLVQTQTEDLN